MEYFKVIKGTAELKEVWGGGLLSSERLDWRVPGDALMEHGEHYTFSVWNMERSGMFQASG